jgi:hypothetical protein
MSPGVEGHLPVSASYSGDGYQVLINELVTQCRPGPGVERPTAAMFNALLQYDDSLPVRSLLTEASAQMVRRRIKPGAAASGLRATLVDYFRNRHLEDYGTEFSDAEFLHPQDWTASFIMLEDDVRTEKSMAASNLINVGLTFLDAATPVKERCLNVEEYSQLIAERFPNGARVLDYGSSVMAGPLFVMHKDKFMPTEFDQVTYQPLNSTKVIDLTDKANTIRNRKTAISEFVCVDVFPVFDEVRKQYDQPFASHALSGLRPSERNNPTYFNELKAAMSLKQLGTAHYDTDPKVTFKQANFLEEQDLNDFKDEFSKPFDIIVMNFVTQELAPEDQIRLHTIACSLLSDNGIILYNHQASIDGRVVQPSPIEAVRHYSSYASTPWLSNGHVFDSLHPIKGVQEMMNYYDNRCQRVRLGMGKLMVNGSLVPIGDLIQHA